MKRKIQFILMNTTVSDFKASFSEQESRDGWRGKVFCTDRPKERAGDKKREAAVYSSHCLHTVKRTLCELHNFLTNTRKIYENAV